MKNLLATIITLFIVISIVTAQTKEVLIIGTMHEVPKITKKAYQPLYKKALAYAPDQIYVETAMPNDSLSWDYLKNGYSTSIRQFAKISDSLKVHYNFDRIAFDKALAKDLEQMSQADLKILVKGFAYLRDKPNFIYYKLIKEYGLNFKKHFRYETQDLTGKLAIALKHKKVFATDDQQTNGEFHENWSKCTIATAKTKYLSLIHI